MNRETTAASLSSTEEIQYSLNNEDYELGKVIGFGSSAVVYVAMYKPAHTTVAIKSMDLDQFERNQIDELRKELQVMSLCKHPNLLNVKGSFVVGSKLYIVTPFLSAGSCLDIMKSSFPDGLDEASICCILKQALQGLEYLHRNNLIHRDVKAGNLLMDEDGTVKLADFGVSSSLHDSDRNGIRKTFVGTPCWIAPEVVQQTGHNSKADIWSFGITALELAHGRAPFAKYPPMKVLLMTLQNDPPTLDRNNAHGKFTKVFKEMIDSCLQKDPTRRPTAEKLLTHGFFKNVKKNSVLVENIIKKVPPVTDRPHNEPYTKEEVTKIEDGWDFGSIPNMKGISPYVSNETISSVSEDPLSGSSSEFLRQSMRHVSMPDPAAVRDIMMDPKMPLSATTSIGTIPSVQQKKGRFVVDVAVASQASGTETSAPNTAPVPGTSSPSTAVHSRKSSANPPPPAGLALAGVQDQNGPEVRKGRFKVIGESTPAIPESANSNREDGGKSRFEFRQITEEELTQQPLERRTSETSEFSASPSMVHQAPGEKKKDTAAAAESLRKGRFEVTSSSHVVSPSTESDKTAIEHPGQYSSVAAVTSISPSVAAASFVQPGANYDEALRPRTVSWADNINSPIGSPPHSPKSEAKLPMIERLASIITHREVETGMLCELLYQLRGRRDTLPQKDLGDNTLMKMGELSNLVSTLVQENTELRKENADLKEALRKQRP